MFRSKRFVLIASGVAVMALISGLIRRYIVSAVSPIVQYIPNDIDQVIISVPQDEVIAGMVDRMATVNSSLGDFLIITTNNTFNKQTFLYQLSASAPGKRNIKSLGPDIYLVGDNDILSTYQVPSPKETLFAQRNSRYRQELLRTSDMMMVTQKSTFVPGMKPHAIIAGIEMSNKQMTAYFIPATKLHTNTNAFSPQLTSYADKNSFLYIEGQTLYSLATDLGILLPLSGDLAKQATLLDQPLAVALSPGANPRGIAATLMSNSPETYIFFKNLTPLITTKLREQNLFSGAATIPVDINAKFGYDLVLDTLRIGVVAEQTKEMSKLSLGNPVTPTATTPKLSRNKNSKLAFSLSMDFFLTLLQQTTNLGITPDMLTTQQSLISALQGTTLKGSLDVENNIITIQAKVR